MKIVLISDTHNKHYEMENSLPEGDMIIHAGDVSGRGTIGEIDNFLRWFKKLPYKHKIMIAGNHDFGFEDEFLIGENHVKDYYPEITYLNDSFVVVDGIKIYGSPITPWFNDWAFNRQRGKEIRKHWSKIPFDVDILVTHGPAYGYGDELLPRFRREGQDKNVGCKDLLEKIGEVNPKYHIFGHIHEGYGVYEGVGSVKDTQFINASVLDDRYQFTNKPIIIKI